MRPIKSDRIFSFHPDGVIIYQKLLKRMTLLRLKGELFSKGSCQRS